MNMEDQFKQLLEKYKRDSSDWRAIGFALLAKYISDNTPRLADKEIQDICNQADAVVELAKEEGIQW